MFADPHALYIIAAYAIFALALIGMYWRLRTQRRRLLADIRRFIAHKHATRGHESGT